MAEFDGLAAVLSRNAFYRDNYRKLLWVVLGQTILILVLAIALALRLFAGPDYRYFSTTTEGKLTPMAAVNEPNFAPDYVIGWTSKAVQSIMALDYRTYQGRLQQNSFYFTRTGWTTFMDQLQGASQLLKGLVERQWAISVTPLEPAKITKQGVIDGVYSWEVQLPVTVKYEGKTNFVENKLIILRVQRTPLIEQPSGLGISQWIEAKWQPKTK